MMKKYFLPLILFMFLFNGVFSQNPSDTTLRVIISQNSESNKFHIDDLYLLGKIWGFLKYYHPEIAAGKYNWDKELINFLPGYVKVKSIKERNDSLESWIERLGETSSCESCNDSFLTNAKLKPDFSWMTQSDFSRALTEKLLFIKNNRSQMPNHYIKIMEDEGVNLVLFQNEPAYSKLQLPNDPYGLLALFRFWNVIEYWYPYKYHLTMNWDDVLRTFIPKMLEHRNGEEYAITMLELIKSIQDGHGISFGPLVNELHGLYTFPVNLISIEGRPFVSSVLNDSLARLSNFQPGDIIESIDGIPVSKLIEQYKSWVPGSNEKGVLRYIISMYLSRSKNQQSKLTLIRSNQTIETISHNLSISLVSQDKIGIRYFAHQRDSAFYMINEKTGYINMGVFQLKDSLQIKIFIGGTQSLIIDNRQNQNETGSGGASYIQKLLTPEDNSFCRFSTAQPTYPGVFSMLPPTNFGMNGSKNPYNGKVVILINTNTQSVGELITMMFQKALHPTLIGETTAGADGNTSYIILPGNLGAMFTGLGVYYPDGGETQRVGIQPDIRATPTIKGYLQGRDEQLERAIEYLSTGK